jgi:N-acetylmuramoyl-L-alanine amidase
VKRIILLFSIFLTLFYNSYNQKTESKRIITKVVIDAGHGGDDPGCLGSKSKEKDIALSIALKVGDYIKKAFPEIKVIYTRSSDVFVELYKRAKIANDNKADLFISIHCNSSKSTTPFGAETWVMGLHKTEENLELSKKENSSILLEEDYQSKYDNFDPNSTEANIIFSLFQNAYLEQSINFAGIIQKQFKTRVGMNDRGVKQAGFLVLYKTTMPGVLIETGFLSNKKEEVFLNSIKGQEYIASAIYRAFKEYKIAYDANSFSNKDLVNQDTSHNTTQNYYNFSDTTVYNNNNLTKKDTLKNNNNNLVDPKINNNTNKQDVVFKVQFYTSPSKKPVNSKEFNGLTGVDVYFHGGMYKYTVGNEKTLQAAVNLQKAMLTKGYKDAFVVAFLNGERISPADAVKILNKK